ncbi:hypothetical protein FSB08_38755 [Paraburkholderia sp. JPY432]|nr:hypothetical protein [Paraburkholderia youngii]
MMPPEDVPVSALARETRITEQTLYVWRREAKGKGWPCRATGRTPKDGLRKTSLPLYCKLPRSTQRRWPSIAGAKGCISNKSRRGGPHVWPPTRMLPNRRASNVSSPKKTSSASSNWKRSCSTKRRHWRKLRRCSYFEKKPRRPGENKRTTDQRP